MATSDARAANRHVRKAIRELIEPALLELGFAGKYPEFHRQLGREEHFILFQTAKYGGSFNFSGAWASKGAAQNLAQTDYDRRAGVHRMVEVGLIDGTTAMRSVGSFEYAWLGDDPAACHALVKEALSRLPALDHWLKTREVGPGISCKGHRLRSAISQETHWLFALGMTGSFQLGMQRPETPGMDAQRATSLAPEYRPSQGSSGS